MDKLLIFNAILIAMIALGLWCVKKCVKTERGKNILLICAAFFTVLCHYSSLPYHYFTDGTAMEFLRDNPNLILPIYPCNVVMWSAVIFAFCKNKQSKVGMFLADYLFWFGIVSTLVGMFANVDFIRNPTLLDFDVTKGIVAHATLLFNVLLMPLFGYVKMDMKRNMKSIGLAVLEMLAIGLYCNLVFHVLVSKDAAYAVNSMFLIHSPFEGVEFLTYPVIALTAILLYFLVFAVCEMVALPKGERFSNRFARWVREHKKA